METKLKEYFDDMVVFKDLKESNFFKDLNLPSFLRDWLLKMFENEEGKFDVEELTNFVKTYIPSKTEWIGIKNRIVVENERVKLLTRISVDINITTHEVSFSLPDFGLGNKETIIDSNVPVTSPAPSFNPLARPNIMNVPIIANTVDGE